MNLSLSLLEMIKIKSYFKKIARNPTDIELETIAQTWSEHCKHKTLTGIIKYTEKKNGRKKIRVFNNLLKETIFRATIELNKKQCLSVFKDNAGVVEFDHKNAVAFKVETHNHPAALEPYGGAATGIGGVVRDILGVGLGAKPVAATSVFCFANLDIKKSQIPTGACHPKRIAKGIISGVRDYGNKIGIPIVNGATCFDDGYIVNPLVFCGAIGIIPQKRIEKKICAGDLILIVGGKTGRDGVHGATFSSINLDQQSNINAVQIGNPIVEKKILDVMLKARDLNFYKAVTDCGAGGLSSAIGELAEQTGAVVYLDKVPVKYSGLRPWEIWISESQERMVIVVERKNKKKIIKIFNEENVEATFIGEFTNSKKLVLMYKNNMLANMDMFFIHKDLPKPVRYASYTIKNEQVQEPIKLHSFEILKLLKYLLADLNICSKEWIIRQYDHEVQGQTIIKPLHGNTIETSGHGDASVIFPYTIVKATKKGIVLSNGLNPRYGKINTYKMAASAIEESLRNAVSVGADIDKISILDNFCWGDTDKSKILGSLIYAAKACYDMSKAFCVPFISGKDSLHNEYFIDKNKYSIPPVLLISAIGIINDVTKTVTMPFKKENNKIYILGVTRNELGGSMFTKFKNIKNGIIPVVYYAESKIIMKKIYETISKNLIESCHDCSDGGLAVAVSEMSFASNKGVKINIDTVKTEPKDSLTVTEIMFSESNGRFIVEVKPENEFKFKKIFKNLIFSEIGYIINEDVIIFESKKHKLKVKEKLSVLSNFWRRNINL
jgi:phosphoribosylformylglycinamidine synthase